MATSIVNTQSLSNVVNVSVQLSAGAVAAPAFNQALFIGQSAVIPTYGTNPRIRRYTSLTAMIADGFTSAMPEYVAASLYFGQSPSATYLWIARQDLTAIQTVGVGATGGLNYVVGDVLTLVQAGAQGGEVQVTGIGAGGVITSVAIVPQNQGTGYSIASNLTVTGGSGTGAELNILTVGETALQTVQICRIAQQNWYLCVVLTASDADHLAVAQFAEAATPPMQYMYTTSDAAVLAGTAGNICLQLQALGYNRTFGIYSTTQGGTYPNNAHAVAAVAGKAMGLNTGLANSYFVLMYKSLAGITAEPVTATQRTNIENANCNLYLNYANGEFYWIEYGVMASGRFFDITLFVDKLVADIQIQIVNTYADNKFVPQTNAGGTLLAAAANAACADSVSYGFIQPGTWQGGTVLSLTDGASLGNGFLTQFSSYLNQSKANQIARIAQPLYVCVIGGSASQSLTVSLTVQQ